MPYYIIGIQKGTLILTTTQKSGICSGASDPAKVDFILGVSAVGGWLVSLLSLGASLLGFSSVLAARWSSRWEGLVNRREWDPK